MESNHKKKRDELKSERRVIFNSRTFNSKLFLKLTGHFIHPSIVCIQTLRYERDNRKLAEIEKAIPWLKTFPDLMNFINLKETSESSQKLLIELTWPLFYHYYKQNIMFTTVGEKGEFFSLLLRGKILKLDIVFKKETLTLEEYLVYLFKMKLTKEKEILKKCRILNSSFADIDGENLLKFCKDHPQFNYDKLKEKAKKEIYELGFKLEDLQDGKSTKYIYSIDNYIRIADIKKNTKIINNILATPKFYIGSYEKVGYITKGMSIGHLIPQLYIDNSTYITTDSCDIVYINKKNSNLKKLYELIREKKKRILFEIKNSFFILRKITENFFLNDIIPFFEYKLYHKGDKIFVQGSAYEGIYLIKSGKIDLYINSSIIEISTYISNIKKSIYNLKDFISNIKMFKSLQPSDSESLKSNIKESIFSANKKTLYEINKYDILTISDLSIFGTNELYDYKTGLYYFTAECISKEAIIYFLPKKYFYSLLKLENPVYIAMAEAIQDKAKYIIEKLKLILKWYERNNNIKNNIENDDDYKMKTFTVFNDYKNSSKNFRRNNIINKGLKLSNKTEEKTYEFPVLLKEKYFGSLKKDNFEISHYDIKTNKVHNTLHNIREGFYRSMKERNINNSFKDKVMKTMANDSKIHINVNNNTKNIQRRNKTFKEKILLNKTRINFDKKINLNLPSNFPYNVKNEFPKIIKSKKNYNIRNIFFNVK